MKNFGWGRFFQGNSSEEGSAEPAETSPPTTRLTPNPGTTIMLVDDSKTIHVVLSSILSRQGYETLSAFDGETAIELAREHKPALILMDVVMPGLNGFHATREIRKDSDPAVASLPIIIMSGNAQPTEEFWSVKIKANGFISKPFADDELFERIEKLLFTDTD